MNLNPKGPNMKSMITTLLALTLVLSSVGCADKEPEAAPQPAAEKAATAPATTPATAPRRGELGYPAAAVKGLTYVKGKPVTFEKDKVYVVEFWATWCPPCRESIPHLTALQKQYKDKGLTIIGVSSEPVETVRPYIEKMGETMDYTIAVDTGGTVTAAYMDAYQQRGIPTAFIVDGQGRIAWVGYPVGEMDDILEKVVAGDFDPQRYATEKAERLALDQRLQGLFRDYFMAVQNGASADETRPTAEKIIEIGHSEALDALAWQILSGVEESRRDTAIALKAIEKANTQTGGENPSVLDTYALALFRSGKVAEAIQAQEKAVERAADHPQMQAELKTRLEQYRQTQPDATP
jgi:thiol-disulfide isomerase/thioredoxin